jgi:hypothetical protein
VEQCFVPKTKEEEEEIERCYKKYGEIISILPKEKGWGSEIMLRYKGFWFYPNHGLEGLLWMQDHFKARLSDVYLITYPKSGTTWLKALIFSIMNRTQFNFSKDHPLLTHSPHQCVPFLEDQLLGRTPIGDPEILPDPRIFASHLPFALLPTTITDTGCKIVYICRDPKDVFVSMWHFMTKLQVNGNSFGSMPLEEAFNLFCQGVSTRGPYWDNVLGFWKASFENPNNVLFLKYEDMKRETLGNVKKLARFLGYPFTLGEEENGVVQEIIELCSFEIMSNLEVNKSGKSNHEVKFNLFFRNAKVGDWKNYLTPEMIERMDQITLEKFSASGLKF